MKSTDYLWQYFIDQEKQQLMDHSVEELLAMAFFTDRPGVISYGVWHESPEWRDNNAHSFILMANRNIFLGVARKYISGFSINALGVIIPISDEILYSYD